MTLIVLFSRDIDGPEILEIDVLWTGLALEGMLLILLANALPTA